MDQPRSGSSINYDARLVNKGDPSISSSQRAPNNTRTQPPTPPFATEQNQLGASRHHQVSFQEPLPYYGHSPNSLSSPSTSSVEQSAPGELSQGSAFYPSKSHTRDMNLKLNIPGFRLKIHLPLKFCKRIHSLVPLYGLRTMAMIYRTHSLAQL
jgi:hypothetical protein